MKAIITLIIITLSTSVLASVAPPPPTPLAEPGTLALLGMGAVVGLVIALKRKK